MDMITSVLPDPISIYTITRSANTEESIAFTTMKLLLTATASDLGS